MLISLDGNYPKWTKVHSEKIIEAVKYLVPFKDRDSIDEVYWDYEDERYIAPHLGYISNEDFGKSFSEDDVRAKFYQLNGWDASPGYNEEANGFKSIAHYYKTGSFDENSIFKARMNDKFRKSGGPRIRMFGGEWEE